MLIKAGDIISKSIVLYRENWKLFFSYIGLFFIPTSFYQIIVTVAGDRLETTGGTIVLVLLTLLMVLINIWLSIAFIRTIADLYTGQAPKNIKTELLHAKPVFWPSIVASILAGLIIIVGTFLLVIPGIIFSIWYAFVFYAVILDKKGATESLKESKNLVVGRWWSVLWRLLAPGVVFGLLTIIIQGILGLTTYFGLSFGTIGLIISLVLITAGGLFVAPLSTAAPTILYLELKKTPARATTPAVQS